MSRVPTSAEFRQLVRLCGEAVELVQKNADYLLAKEEDVLAFGKALLGHAKDAEGIKARLEKITGRLGSPAPSAPLSAGENQSTETAVNL